MTVRREFRIGSGALLVVALALAATAGPAVATAGASSADAVALQPDGESAVNVSADDLEGQSYWQGQTLEITGFDAGETVELDHEDDYVEEDATDDGTVTLQTEGRSTGDWSVNGADSGTSGEFTLRQQTVDVSVGESAFGGPALAIESNRATYDVDITSDGLDAETLAEAMAFASVDGDHVRTEVNSTVHNKGVDVGDLPAGEYELSVDVADTTASDTVTLTGEPDPVATVDVEELDERSVWQGQHLVVTGFDVGQTVEVVHDESTRELAASDGTIRLDTSEFATGTWEIEPGAFGSQASFTVREQTLEANGGTTTGTWSTEIDSNRANYELAVSSDDVEAETLAAAVENANVVGNRAVVEVDDTGAFHLDTSELAGGEYELHMQAVDSTASDTAALNVTAGVEVEGNHPLPYAGQDELYDVNGDRTLSNSDVVQFFGFQHYHSAVEEYPEKFDFDGSGTVGQSDVIELFEVVNGAPFPDPDADPDAEFVDSSVSEEAGYVAAIELDVAGTDEAWVTIENEHIEGNATVHVEDIPRGEQRVRVLVDTHNLSHPVPREDVFTVEGGELGPDTESVDDFADIGQNRWPGGFSFTLRSYVEDPDQDHQATDRARLSLVEPTTATFAASTHDVAEGEVATVDIDIENVDETWLEIEHGDLNGSATVHVEDIHQENVTVGIDTASLSQGEPVEDVFGVLGAELGPDTEETGQFADIGDNQWSEGMSLQLRTFTDDPEEMDADDRSRLSIGAPSGDDASAQFEASPYSVVEEEVATFEVDLTATDEALVTIEHENYTGTGTVHLENAYADSATVSVDTSELSQDAPVSRVFDVEGAELGPQTSETGEFATAREDAFGGSSWPHGTALILRSYAVEGDSFVQTDRSRLTVDPSPTGEVTTHVAPATVDHASADDPAALLEDATQSDTVAAGDVVVAEVNSVQTPSVGENASDVDPTDQDLRLYLEREEAGAFGTTTETVDVETIAEDVSILHDDAEERFLVAFDVDDVADVGEEWDVVFEVGPENDRRTDDATDPIDARSTFDVAQAEMEFAGEIDENDRLLVENGEDSEIAIETNLAPGTDGEVYVETQHATYTEDLTVDEEGTASVTLDFDSANPGDILATIEANVFGSSDHVITTEGLFVDQDGPSFDVSVSAPERAADGTATIDVTVTNDGRQTDDAEVSVTAGGTEINSFVVQLEPGESVSSSYQIDVAPNGTDWAVETQTDLAEGTVERA